MQTAPPQDAPAAPLGSGFRTAGRFLGATLLAAVTLTAAHGATGPALGPADWRDDPVFTSNSAAIETWLGDPEAVAAWRAAVDSVDAASRLGPNLLELAARTDPRLGTTLASREDTPPAWLTDADEPAAASLRLAVAESLALARRYDAALAWTEGLGVDAVYSPDLLRYVRALAAHETIDDELARAALKGWFETDDGAGHAALGRARWWVVKTLLRVTAEEPAPLPLVTRRMDDVHRRLALDQPGETTQQRQKTILDELDKLIEQLEEQRRQQLQQQQAAGGGGRGAEPGSPAEESRPGELKGAGEVDRKRLVAGDAWGALPPAERERLTQAITRDFPPHYRALVEDYFRTLADEADTAERPPGER